MPEYRGYDHSGGKPTQQGIAKDMIAFREWLLNETGADNSSLKVIYHGRSLGGGVACELSRVFPPDGMILQSTFTSVRRLALRFGGLPFFVQNPFRNDLVVQELDRPILFIHGNQDKTVPVEHAKKLISLAREPSTYFLDADHDDLPEDSAYWRKIQTFTDSL